MKDSFVHPGLDNENNSYEFDPHMDFSQFLEEAKKQISHDMETPRVENAQKSQNQQVFINQEVTKKKKSWRNVLFPFWRSSSKKKSKGHSKETSRNVHDAKPKPRDCVSGPIYGSRGAGAASSGRFGHRLLGSGPLTGLFQNKERKENNEIPYVSLDKLNKPTYDATVYGPVYSVS